MQRMCATKMDYYCNTGLSRPCYNAQIAVSDGVIVNAELYQRPADSKTSYHSWKDIKNIMENIQNIQWQMQDMEVLRIICIVQIKNGTRYEIFNVCQEK